jgi:hypothetical protein
LKLSPAQRLAISHSGLAHLRLAASSDVFVEQLSFTTELRSDGVATQLRSLIRKKGDFAARRSELRDIFVTDLLREDALLLNSDANNPQYASQSMLIRDLKKIAGMIDQSETLASEKIEKARFYLMMLL